MNYLTLKSMIQSLMQGYSCPACNHNTITEQNIDIVGAAGNTVNIDMKCPACSKHYMARMEVMGLDLSNTDKFSQANIQNMKIGIDSIKAALNKIKEQRVSSEDIGEENTIKDDEIVDLSRNLKNKKLSVSDLFE